MSGRSWEGGGGGAFGEDILVECNCRQPAARRILGPRTGEGVLWLPQGPASRTVAKEDLNTCRQFYCCPKPREEQCGFFQWADELEGGKGGGYNRRRGVLVL